MADETPAAQTKQATIPYTSWRSLLNVADRFKESGLPPRVDRSVVGGSEGQKTQILGAMRFFGWVRENGDVTELFVRFVSATDKERHQIMKELLAKHYPKATELAAVNATTRQLEESFVGISGDTLRKAVGFYLGAAKYAGHPLSKHFKVPSFVARSVTPRNARRQGGSGGASADDGDDGEEVPVTRDPKTRYIEMLMEKAATAEGEIEEKLLDRIERLLGYPS